MRDADIAIVGAACRFPGAPDLQAFETLLFSGGDAVTEIPEERGAKDFFHDADVRQPGKSYTFAAGILDAIDRFDAGFFGISPREAAHIDPQQRLLLELAYEAAEDAGLTLSALAGSKTGVFVGASSFDYLTHRAGDVALMEAHSMQGLALSSIANRVSYAFDLHGPSLTVDTACSSSLVALHLGCEAIRTGDTAAALVGGVNLLIAPQGFIGFSRASMLSPRGRCHAFDARADGYVRSEGGAVLVLKPLRNALADGDEIRGVIRATGVNSDGRTTGLSLPSRDAQARLLREVYARAETSPDALCYLEAHGTGTPVGDPIEASAIAEALARHRSTPLPIGSVKSNIGHLEAASGMAGVLKVLLAFQRREAPPSLHCETPNPNIPFAEHNLALTAQPLPLEAGADGLVAGVNSFGFGGTNAHVVLAAPPERPVTDDESLPPLLISARDEEALRTLAEGWRDRLRALRPTAETAAMVRGAARRREAHSHRLAAFGRGPDQIAEDLDAWLSGAGPREVATGQASDGRLAFVFSGNGSQWAGMGRTAYAQNAAFRDAVAEVDSVLAPQTGWSVAERLAQPLSSADLADTTIAQPMLFAVQAASVRALAAAGIKADAFVGHSVGEVAAAWAAGALTLTQACQVVAHRSRLQGLTRGQGGMAALGLSPEMAAEALAEIAPALAIAAINSATSVTVSGPDADLVALERQARSRRWLFSRLDLDYAFHSAAMDLIRAELLEALALMRSGAPAGCLVSTVTGAPVEAGALGADYWWRNVRAPVQFGPALDALRGEGVRLFLEIGPQPILQSYIRDGLRAAHAPGRALASLTKADPTDVDPFLAIAARCHVAGASMAGAAMFDGPSTARGLPAYPWSRQVHWLGRTGEGVELNALRRSHPLLGFRRDDADQSWFNHLSVGRQPWLADHQVDGAVVLPAAAMIDMALAAARARHPDAAVLEVSDLEITRPMLLDGGPRDVRFAITSSSGGFALDSRPRLSEDAPVIHARGRIAAGGHPGPLLALEADAASPRTLDADAFYALTRRMRLQYGPAFQTVAAARVSGRDFAEVEFASADGDPVGDCLLDPTVLDGALQGLAALYDPASEDATAVPWRFGRVRLLQPGVRPTRARIQVRSKGPRAVSADLVLLDAEGGTVAELSDCWFVGVDTRRAAAEREHRFWTALVPTAEQPVLPPVVGLFEAGAAAVTRREDLDPTMLLAEAFVLAAAQEAVEAVVGGADRSFAPSLLAFEGRVAARSLPLFEGLVELLAAEGVLVPAGEGWRFDADAALPPSDLIWRSLLTEAPSAVAEAALAAVAAEELGRRLRDGSPSSRPSSELAGQMLFASPSGAAALAGLRAAVLATAAAWPQGRPLRLALIGATNSAWAGALAAELAATGVALRCVAYARSEDELAALGPALADTPGAGAVPWDERRLGEHDLVAGLYAFDGAMAIEPQAAAELLADGGLLLAAAPETGRFFPLAMGGLAATQTTDAAGAAVSLLGEGCDRAETFGLPGALWPAALVVARRSTRTERGFSRPTSSIRILAPEHVSLAAGLARSLESRGQGVTLSPVEALESELLGGQDLLLFAPEGPDALGELPAFCGRIATQAARLGLLQGLRLWLVAADPAVAAGVEGLRRVLANEAPDLDCWTVGLASDLEHSEKLDRLVLELTSPDAERALVHTRAGRFAPRLRLGAPPLAPAAQGARKLHVERPGLLSSLTWTEMTPAAPGPDEVAIEVRAAGLNFRDVMWAAGLLPDEALLQGFSGPGFGLECAGVVTAVGSAVSDLHVGQRVVAVSPAALATHAVTKRHAVLAVPDGVGFEAAATLPVAFLTAVYGLGWLARLERGERVLIHGGAGGVGLAAIQYAQHLGAEVFATAGSPAKRELLRRLGVQHVLDSRSAAFADEILQRTGGEGVDVVLNSLSDALMKQSLRLLRPFGRFVEIGKRDLFGDTEVGLRPLRHNASYFAVDVDQLAALKPNVAQALFTEIEGLLAEGVLTPLPHRTFRFSEVTDAFRLMQGSGHVGKIVLAPDEATPAVMPMVAPFGVREDRTYVVTGGLGGFGLETARWLARRGAKRLALLSRRGPADTAAVEVVAGFAREGVTAQVLACDVADATALAGALDAVRAVAPIGGVVHAAMVIDDGLLGGLTAERFRRVLAPKAQGAANLDTLTRGDPVELFVLYSSISAAVGNPGQAPYVVANAALEAVAERRRAEGLPAVAVRWGPIADAGYLARETRVREMLDSVLGEGDLSARRALDALPALAQGALAVPGYADVDWPTLRRQLPIGSAALFAEMPAANPFEAGSGALRDRLAALSEEEAHATVLDVLVEETAAILRLPRTRIDVHQPLADIGCDSLMAVELRLAIEARLGGELPLLSVGDGAALDDMARRIVRSVRGVGEGPDEAQALADQIGRHEGEDRDAILTQAAE
jgi:acyl transferase domain-containing protein/NADPH:quinone reductase-like Zn-dependent oxidoreductase/NAD(P)-dependent dehydrogenase (short-subunit alcohol dehydrogenase family)/acyl carrier protein